MNLRVFSLMLVLAAAGGFTAAADVAADFSAGNKLYAEGKFAEAANAYESTIQSARTAGTASPALYFNAGNAGHRRVPARGPAHAA